MISQEEGELQLHFLGETEGKGAKVGQKDSECVLKREDFRGGASKRGGKTKDDKDLGVAREKRQENSQSNFLRGIFPRVTGHERGRKRTGGSGPTFTKQSIFLVLLPIGAPNIKKLLTGGRDKPWFCTMGGSRKERHITDAT